MKHCNLNIMYYLKINFKGNKAYHYCNAYNSRNTYPIPMEENENYTNCYQNSTFNFYFDDDNNHICLNESTCEVFAPLLIDKTKHCIKRCNNKKNIYI